MFQTAIRKEEQISDKVADDDAEERQIAVVEEETHEKQCVPRASRLRTAVSLLQPRPIVCVSSPRW